MVHYKKIIIMAASIIMLAACSSPKGEPEIVYLPYPMEKINPKVEGISWQSYFELKNVTRKQSNDSILGPRIAQVCDSAIQIYIKKRAKYDFRGKKKSCEKDTSWIYDCKDEEYVYIYIFQQSRCLEKAKPFIGTSNFVENQCDEMLLCFVRHDSINKRITLNYYDMGEDQKFFKGCVPKGYAVSDDFLYLPDSVEVKDLKILK